jgi:hypothetical protein
MKASRFNADVRSSELTFLPSSHAYLFIPFLGKDGPKRVAIRNGKNPFLAC